MKSREFVYTIAIMRCFRRYRYSIISGGIIVVTLYASYFILGELNPVIAAVGGLLFSIPIKLFWHSYVKPVLKIKGEPEIRDISLPSITGTGKYAYRANRIIVKNIGRSAAKNCKGYIVFKNSQERVCWTVTKERPNATINSKDEERLDFCAFYQSGPNDSPPRTIAPTEDGWVTPSLCRKLDGIEECYVLITTENAEPVITRIRFDTTTDVIIIN
jgi:hypothetical protein